MSRIYKKSNFEGSTSNTAFGGGGGTGSGSGSTGRSVGDANRQRAAQAEAQRAEEERRESNQELGMPADHPSAVAGTTVSRTDGGFGVEAGGGTKDGVSAGGSYTSGQTTTTVNCGACHTP